jgi:hypothetical protein
MSEPNRTERVMFPRHPLLMLHYPLQCGDRYSGIIPESLAKVYIKMITQQPKLALHSDVQ